MKGSEIRFKLNEKGLKITPQRIVILEAIAALRNHPTAENIIDHVRKKHPNIATATVYKVLDTLEENELIVRVKTEKGIMRYDAIVEKHHHLYSAGSDRIEDYFDTELNELIDDYFKRRGIPDFKIDNIKLQIIGKFTDKNSQ
jgi:Fur family transcriptional regulator, peroxide stress response regulator